MEKRERQTYRVESIMSEKRFICIDVGYGEDEYVEDNGKRLSCMEVVDKLNEQQSTIRQ